MSLHGMICGEIDYDSCDINIGDIGDFNNKSVNFGDDECDGNNDCGVAGQRSSSIKK